MGIAENYKRVHRELCEQCEADGRNPEDVLLLAVSKTTDIDGVAAAISAGARDFGENRPDELLRKFEAFPDARWHFIGNIQSRRIKDIVRCSYLVHSLHEERHARKMSDEALAIGKVQDVLLEVNVSGEESKGGLAPSEVSSMLRVCESLPGIRVRGFMTMAPQGDLDCARECFEGLAELLCECGLPSADQLSMGMSEDWREAVGARSTIVRIGRAVFSEDF